MNFLAFLQRFFEANPFAGWCLVIATIGAAIIILVLFVRGFVKGLRARRRASGDANAEDTRFSHHLASLLDQVDKSSPDDLVHNAVALFVALGKIELRRQSDNERHPTFELTRFGGWMLVGLIALSLLGNATLGYAVYRGQMGQRVLAAELVRVSTQVGPMFKTHEKVPLLDRFNLITARLDRHSRLLAGDEHLWLGENYYELNRLLLLHQSMDADGDGVVNTEDDCPTIPFGEAASEPFPGCPSWPDTDEDGVFDIEDQCPEEKGATKTTYSSMNMDDWVPYWLEYETPLAALHAGGYRDQFLAAHLGCPDKDGDGVVDTMDVCPESPGRYDDDLDGCPDTTTDVSTRWNFYKSPDDWATPDRTTRGDHMAFSWYSITRADGVETSSFYVSCLALDVDGKPIPSDAKEFKFGKYSECYIR